MNNCRAVAVIAGTLTLLGVACAAFWRQDWRYSLPAQRPDGFTLTPIASPHAPLLRRLGLATDERAGPALLHFYNPDCPCSRFNLDHLAELWRRHSHEAQFLVVLEANPQGGDALKAWRRQGIPIPAIVDEDGAVARELGVFATPQAVILDSQGNLAFRGNYNLNRYCTRRETQFARLALEALLAGKTAPPSPTTDQFGCVSPVLQQPDR